MAKRKKAASANDTDSGTDEATMEHPQDESNQAVASDKPSSDESVAESGKDTGSVKEEIGAAVAQHTEEAKEQIGESVAQHSDEVKAAVSDSTAAVKEEVASLASDLKASAKAAAADVGHVVAEQAKAVGAQVTDVAAARAQVAKESTADKIHETADAVRHRSTLPQATVIDRGADKIDEASEYVRQHDYGEMRDDFKQAVRTQPILAVALAFIAGYLIGSILKQG